MQSLINKIILSTLFLVVFYQNLSSCTLCQLEIPTVKVDTKVSSLSEKTFFSILWRFDKQFISTLTQYDLNNNQIFEEDEQKEIRKSLEEYLFVFNYLTQITYNNQELLQIKPTNLKFEFIEGDMVYQFDFETNFTLKKGDILSIKFHDRGNNFNFILNDITLKNYAEKYKIEPQEHQATIHFLPLNQSVPIQKENKVEPVKTEQKETITIEKESLSFYQFLQIKLEVYKEKIKKLLDDIKQNNSVTSYLWLLFFSFLYGILHALGPGHGKSLVGSYFLTQNHSVLKAFYISTLIGVVHTFSAFLLTVVVYFLLNLLFLSFLNDVEYFASKISAIIIIAIASYLIYKKYKSYNTTKTMQFSTHNPQNQSCGCGGCNTKSEDLGVILAAGIIPCPGTVTIFIFTFGLGIYLVGFLSAIFMSIGMSFVIFTAAFLSIKLKKQTSTNERLKKLLEYLSLGFILCLGLFLLLV